MGIDLRIHITLKDGAAVPGFTLRDEGEVDINNFDKWVECKKDNAPNGATHVYDSLARLYSRNYSRGDWPMISAMLLRLFEDENVTEIWYDGDAGDPCEDGVMHAERFLEITRHFIAQSR